MRRGAQRNVLLKQRAPRAASREKIFPTRFAQIIRAFIIKTRDDIKKALDYPCDYLLLDNGLGTGETFDWSLIHGIDKPFFLAGGLTPENVRKAIAQTHPYGVDTSSGVETNNRKDYQKIKAFINAVKGGEHV